MYRVDFGKGPFKQSKYFVTYSEAAEYCRLFRWSVNRIKSVH